MTKVEEIARAIYDADNDLDGDCVGDMIYGDFRIDGPAVNAKEQTMRVCRAAALAALKAMREPSEGMKRAGRIPTREIPLGNGTTATGFGLMWGTSLMWEHAIDAAIAEHVSIHASEGDKP